MRHWFSLLFYLLISLNATSQFRQFLFSYLGRKDGLEDENVHSIQQDQKGFLWIASSNALQRYDGNRFLTLNHLEGNPQSLPDAGIKKILLDQKNRLWILTAENTIGFLDVNNFRFTPIPIRFPDGSSNKSIGNITEDKDGHIIVVTTIGFFLTVNEQKMEAAIEYNPFQMPAGWELYQISQDKNQNYWLGCQQGLLKYNPDKKLFSYRGHNAEMDPVIRQFESLTEVIYTYMDHSMNFWLITWPHAGMKIKSYNLATGLEISWQQQIGEKLKGKYFEMQGITEGSDSTLWLGGQSLLGYINRNSTHFDLIHPNASQEYSIRYDHISQILQDRENNIWVCTNKGLFRFNPFSQLITSVNNTLPGSDSIINADVTGFLETREGTLLVSTWGNGTFTYDKNLKAIPNRYFDRRRKPQMSIWCMVEMPNGDIWQGIQEGIIQIYHAANGDTIQLRPPEFASSTIRQIVPDKNGNLWLGTQKGFLIKWMAAENRFEKIHELNGAISRIICDSANHIWVCTDKNGVFKINADKGNIEANYSNKGPANKTIRISGASDILQYNDSIFVIASDGLNILNILNDSIRYLTKKNGLQSTNLHNLLKDKEGYIWMTGSTGIYSYNPALKKLSTYNESDGVLTTSFSAASNVLLRDGRIMIGTNHNFMVFDPASVTVSGYRTPKVEITGFLVQNQYLSVDSLLQLPQIDLKATENSITIQFSTLTHQNIFRVQYMMEGLNNTVVEPEDQSQVTFSFLPPGNYTFKVGVMDENKSFQQLTSIRIQVHPPFYKSWWFYGLIALLAGSLLFWLDKERINRKEALQKMRTDIATNLHEEVNTALGDINILSEMARIKAEKEPEKSKEFIQQIHSRSQHMMIAMDDMLWSIRPENDNMRRFLERIQEFTEALNNQHATPIQIWVDQKVEKLALNIKYRYEILHLYKETLTALIQIHPDFCKVNLSLEKSTLLFSMEFADKLHPAAFSANLLQKSLSKSLDAAKARLQFQSLETSTALLLEIPVT